ncbi:S8 family serine peptidase [Viscerimonas tarda]
MKRSFILLTFALLCLSLNAQEQLNSEHFYYYKGDKVYLQADYSRISIASTSEFSTIATSVTLPASTIEKAGKSYARQNVVIADNIPNPSQNGDVYLAEMKLANNVSQTTYFNIIQNLQEVNNIIKVTPSYKYLNEPLGTSNNFYVKLWDAADAPILYNLANQHAMQVLGRNEYMPLWFTVACTKETPYNAFEAANLFYETNLFAGSEPEFLYDIKLASSDPYFGDQWGLKNTGQYGGTPGIDIKAEEAWAITTGSPDIKVAVFDLGFELDHPDLEDNVYGTGYNASTDTSPVFVSHYHGNNCAGIIGAPQNNSKGLSGVAPNAKIISIGAPLLTSPSAQSLANGFNWAWKHEVDVINNSWNTIPSAPSDVLENAIDSALTRGRNGKGTIIVFSAGNANNTNIVIPVNRDSLILVVGAVSPCGERKSPTSCDTETLWGSCYGPRLDIMAPGVLIPTTDRQGDIGLNPFLNAHTESGGSILTSDYADEDYTATFNGTSAAAPHVAGVAALVLSANPNLTVKQVNDIIESTAQKVGDYDYQLAEGRTNGAWHEEMGYGLVDAHAAVVLAQNTIPESCTTYINNQTYDTGTHNIFGCTVEITDTTIEENTTVNINSTEGVTIGPDFWAKEGSNVTITASQASPSLLSAKAADNTETATSLEEAVTTQNPAGKFNFTVYPNPNDGNFTVEITGEVQPYTVEIYNASGGMLGKTSCDAEAVNINRSDLPQGIYYVRLLMGKEVATKRVIIK